MGDQRSTRILDTAEDLLLRYGYRRTTVDDVARAAAVGKGTIYLYWPTKAELFGALLARESARMLSEQLAQLRADPAEVRLHRLLRFTYVRTMRRPLSLAFVTRDRLALDDLINHGTTGARLVTGKIEKTATYLSILYDNGLLTDDPSTDPAVFPRLSAVMLGTFALADTPGMDIPGVEETADALATTVRRAFEPAGEPSPEALRAAAQELAELSELHPII